MRNSRSIGRILVQINEICFLFHTAVRQSAEVPFVLSLFLLIFIPRVEAGQFLVQGCEGDDMRVLLSDRTELSWRSHAREIGMWRFTHFARLTCDSRACAIDAGLRSFDQLEGKDAEANESTWSSPVHPSFANGIVTRIDLVGEKAARMYEGLGVGSFHSDDGSKVFVWMDYGYIAETINVRALAEISCHLNENRCSVYDQIFVFIPYGDHDSCGDL